MAPLKYEELIKDPSPATNGKERIVFVLPTLMAGGAERVLITLLNNLDKKRFDTHLVVLDYKGPLSSWISKNIPIHSLGRVKMSRSVAKLTTKLNELEPDIVVSTMAPMNFALLMTKPFLKKKPRIVVREAVIPSSIAEHKIFPWVIKSTYKKLYKHADLVISPARCIIDEFENYIGMNTDNHMLLHNPVVTSRIRSARDTLPKISNKRRRTIHFVCAGRLHAQKGFDRLIKALPSFESAYDWSLTILGEGNERKKLESLIRDYGFRDHVTLYGLAEKPWPMIAAADAFLLPSRWEGLPNVVLESLALGTPVIGMREAGGIQEIATYTAPNALEVVDSMEDFIKAMEHVQPEPTESYRKSLLPSEFELQSVVERFTNIIDSAGIASIATAQEKRTASNQAKTPANNANRKHAA